MQNPIRRIRNGALSLAVVLVTAALGYHWLGGYDWSEAIWMVVITVSTVGFGEHSTATPLMRFWTVGLIIFGVTSSAYALGGFMQLLLAGEVDRILGKRKMARDINRLNGHVIVCGYGRLGEILTQQLVHREIEFVVIDNAPHRVEEVAEKGFLAVHGDATDENVLNEAGLPRARALATSLPTDAENVFITLTARNLRPDIQIISIAEQESSCRKLRQAGANKVVMPHRVGAQQMERMISRPTTADLVELVTEASELNMEFDELRVTPSSDLVGKTLGTSRIKEDFNLLVIGIKNHREEFHFNPPPSEQLEADDTILVMGQVRDINRLKKSRRNSSSNS